MTPQPKITIETSAPALPFTGKRAINPTIEPLFEKLGALCSLPGIAQKIIVVCEDENSDAQDLLEVVEEDAAIATQVLKFVNSAYWGIRGGVADLKTAVTVLGVNKVRNLALTASVGSRFNTTSAHAYLDPQRLWDHSVCVAGVARHVASRTGYAQPEEAYMAGLLHDIGLLFIGQHLDQLVSRVFDRCEGGLPLCESERLVLAFDHAQLGAYVAWRSSLPDRLTLAIDYHHDPLSCPEAGHSLASVVCVANYLATRFGHGSIAGRRLPPPSQQLLEPIGLDLEELRLIWDDLPETITQVREMLNMAS